MDMNHLILLEHYYNTTPAGDVMAVQMLALVWHLLPFDMSAHFVFLLFAVIIEHKEGAASDEKEGKVPAPCAEAGAARLADKFSRACEHRRYNNPAAWSSWARYCRQWPLIVATLSLLPLIPVPCFSLDVCCPQDIWAKLAAPSGGFPTLSVEENHVS